MKYVHLNLALTLTDREIFDSLERYLQFIYNSTGKEYEATLYSPRHGSQIAIGVSRGDGLGYEVLFFVSSLQGACDAVLSYVSSACAMPQYLYQPTPYPYMTATETTATSGTMTYNRVFVSPESTKVQNTPVDARLLDVVHNVTVALNEIVNCQSLDLKDRTSLRNARVMVKHALDQCERLEGGSANPS